MCTTNKKIIEKCRDTFNVNLIFFKYIVDMKNMENVITRNTFQSNKKYRKFINSFVIIIF